MLLLLILGSSVSEALEDVFVSKVAPDISEKMKTWPSLSSDEDIAALKWEEGSAPAVLLWETSDGNVMVCYS